MLGQQGVGKSSIANSLLGKSTVDENNKSAAKMHNYQIVNFSLLLLICKAVFAP